MTSRFIANWLGTRLAILLLTLNSAPILLLGWFVHAQLLDRIRSKRI